MSDLLKWNPFRRTAVPGEWGPASLWNPLRDLDLWDRRMERALRDWPGWPDTREHLAAPDWSPKVDISEDAQAYVVKAEVPDVKKEDLKVKVEDGVLSLSGERRAETEEKGKKFHRVERSYGRFERSFALPPDVDPGGITSEAKDGLLSIRLPKRAQTKPGAVEVKIQ